MKLFNDIDYAGKGNAAQMLDVYVPEGAAKGTLLYYHGGGLNHGSRKAIEAYLPLVEAGYAFISADYRLMPEVQYPGFLEDAAAAALFCHAHAAEWGIPSEIFISGGSAGAWLTMMLALDRQFIADDSFVKGYISESSQMFAHFGIMEARGLDKRLERIDETAPIGFFGPDMKLRPIDIIWYTDDMLCRPEENALALKSLRRFLPDNIIDSCILEGKHLKPARNEDRIAAYLSFMDKLA